MKHASEFEAKTLDVKSLIARPGVKHSYCTSFVPQDSWVGNNPYAFGGEGKLQVDVWFDEEDINVVGTIVVPMNYVCSRCGSNFEENLFIEVQEVLKSEPDEEHFTYKGNVVDFDKIIGELVASNIPQQVLCRQDCKGICLICGKNKNEESCKCGQNLGKNNPFGSLKDKFN
ncbi:MAG: DUF177 domain-containing protein [Clostridia bacterium]|nr:DUF177 domain-containing protein [Clostridia bacterium]